MKLDVPLCISDLEPTPVNETKTMQQCIQETFGVFVDTKADGNFHRFASDSGKNGKDGFYILHSDGDVYFGTYGSWRTGETFNYCSRKNLSFQQRRNIDLTMKRNREQVEWEQRQNIKAAQVEWESYDIATEHPYLTRKGIDNQDCIAKVTPDGKQLVLPVYQYAEDGSYQIVSIQKISATGKKDFKPGCPTKGGFMGIPGNGQTFICEGFATGVSIHKATGAEVVIAFNCGNLPRVVEFFKASKPIVVADNDASGAGEDWAKKCDCPYILVPEVGMDANDYATKYGLEKLTELLEPKEKEKSWLIDVHEDLRQPKPIKWLIKKWLPENSFIMIHGEPASGKSFVALDMMLTLSSGLGYWMGLKAKKANVLYLCGEGFNGLPARINAWLNIHEGADIGSFYRSSWALSLDNKQEGLFAKNGIRALPFKPDLIVIDTLNRFYAGDENSSQDIRVFLEFISELQSEFKAAVMVVHHTGVSKEAQGRARGSSALRGAVDTEISVVKENKILTLEQKKQKDSEIQEPLQVVLNRVSLEGWYDEDGDEITSAVIAKPTDEDLKETGKEDTSCVSEMAVLMNAWIEGEHRFLMGDNPYISRSEIRQYLYREWGTEAIETEDDKASLDQRIKNFLKEKNRRNGLAKIIENKLAVALDAYGEKGVMITDETYGMAMGLELKEKQKNG